MKFGLHSANLNKIIFPFMSLNPIFGWIWLVGLVEFGYLSIPPCKDGVKYSKRIYFACSVLNWATKRQEIYNTRILNVYLAELFVIRLLQSWSKIAHPLQSNTTSQITFDLVSIVLSLKSFTDKCSSTGRNKSSAVHPMKLNQFKKKRFKSICPIKLDS